MATKEWRASQIRQYGFYFHREKEKEILEYFDKIPNKREYLLKLIDEDRKKSTTR